MRYRAATIVLAVLALSATAVVADTLSMALGSVSVITGQVQGSPRGRVLIPVSIPQDVQQGQVDFAVLLIPSLGLPDTNPTITIEARRITTAWDTTSASWSSPWHLPGGDFDTTISARFMIAGGDTHAIRLDVTKAVQAWQSGTANYGILLTRPTYEGDGFATEIDNLRDALRMAKLKFYYHRV